MPSVGHVAVGLAAARLHGATSGRPRIAWALTLVILSCLPDIDVVAFAFGIPYADPFGHRGASHSLAFGAICGLAVAAIAARMGARAMRTGLIAAAVVASHGVLDTLTDGGLGAALLWPLSNERFFAPWRPIPVAPIGAQLLSAHGLELMLRECILFLPLFVAGLWPRRNPRT